jgi:hypothetical protein
VPEARGRGGESEPEDEPTRLFLAASYAVLLAGGVLLALFGAFLLPYSISPATHAVSPGAGTVSSGQVLASGGGGGFGQLLSVGLLVAILVNPLLSFAGYWMAGTRLAAITPLFGWLPIVLLLGSAQSTGSTVLTSDLRSSAFLLLGVISFLGVAVLGRPTRGAGAQARAERELVPTRASRPPATKRTSKPPARGTAPKGGRRR